MARLLELDGHQVVTGSSFGKVESHVWPGGFDVLITDIVMPEMDGLDILRKVADERDCREPVVLITGEPNMETATEAVRRGAFDYVSKPVTKDRLAEVVTRAMRHVQLLRERDEALRKELEILRSLALLGEQSSLLSHEVRAPITALRQALRAVAGKIGVEDKVLVEELVANMERIERLLGLTLSFARPLQLRLQEAELPELVASVVEQARKLPAGKDVGFSVRCSKEVSSATLDRQLVEEVLLNLLCNAGEACVGPVQVEIVVESNDVEIEFQVVDDGPGVASRDRDEIFRPFHSLKKSGTGIGLAFGRKVAEAHGGSLDLVDHAGPGACFRVKLRRFPLLRNQS